MSQGTHRLNSSRGTEIATVKWIDGESDVGKGRRLSWDMGGKGSTPLLAGGRLDQLFVRQRDKRLGRVNSVYF